ncbi:PepSY domain-containing protein, partial [Planktomarina temperata]|nr:PepSY domain-containing protein [Planktomarina temperata]
LDNRVRRQSTPNQRSTITRIFLDGMYTHTGSPFIVVSDTGHYYVKSRLQNKMFAPDGSLENRKLYWAYVFGVFHRTGWLGWSIGTVLADITAIALIIFGFSGLVLWYLPKHKRFKRRLGRMLP